jgi:diaminopimelate epimerase
VRFAKYHGLGNDYLVVEPGEFPLKAAPEVARRACHRNTGVGADGLLVGPLPTAASAPWSLRIFNPDGSEAEKSGNGLRIFARHLWDTGRVDEAPFEISTAGGVAPIRIGSGATSIEVGMGVATFSSADLGLEGPTREVLEESLEVAGERLRIAAVSVGNPHCVVLNGPASAERARALGPLIESNRLFPRRTNVQLLEVLDRKSIKIEIWERGAGYTLASGSSACAAASAAHRLGWCDGEISVHMPGGVLEISIDSERRVTQRGPVTKVAEGWIVREAFGDLLSVTD